MCDVFVGLSVSWAKSESLYLFICEVFKERENATPYAREVNICYKQMKIPSMTLQIYGLIALYLHTFDLQSLVLSQGLHKILATVHVIFWRGEGSGSMTRMQSHGFLYRHKIMHGGLWNGPNCYFKQGLNHR